MIETALVYIFTDTEVKRFVGCGAFVEGGFVATCQHVWDYATEQEGENRSQVILEFPNADFQEVPAPIFIATLARPVELPTVDLVLLQPNPEPIGPMPLPVARHKDYTIGDAFTIPFLRSRSCSSEIHGTISSYRPKESLQQGFSSSELGKYWFEEGSSGAPVFLRPKGMHLAGLLTRAEVPRRAADAQSNALREAFMIPGDIVWARIAQTMAAKVRTAEPVPAASLRGLLDDLGHQGVSAADIPARLSEAFAAMKAAGLKPISTLDAGHDINAVITEAREKLLSLDPQAALETLRRKVQEVKGEQQFTVKRLGALLLEEIKIKRLSFDHSGALASLNTLLEIEPENDWALIESGDILIVIGDRSKAIVLYEKALTIANRHAAPHRVALALERLGDAYVAEGNRSGALQAYEKCLVIGSDLAKSDPSNDRWQRELAVTLSKIGDVHRSKGQRTWALKVFNEALAIAEDIVRLNPSSPQSQNDLSICLERIGVLLLSENNWESARGVFERSLAIALDLSRNDVNNAEWRRNLAISYDHIGDVCNGEKDVIGAINAYSQSLEIRDSLVAQDPRNAELRRSLAVSHDRIGDALFGQDNYSEASERYQKAIDLINDLVRSDVGNTVWQRDFGVAHNKLGKVRLAQNDLREAEALYMKGLEIAENLVKLDQGVVEWQRDLSISYKHAGDVQHLKSDKEEAVRFYTQAILIRQRLSEQYPADVQLQTDFVIALCLAAELDIHRITSWQEVIERLEAIARAGKLDPSDQSWLEEARNWWAIAIKGHRVGKFGEEPDDTSEGSPQ